MNRLTQTLAVLGVAALSPMAYPNHPESPSPISIDLDHTGDPINPFIYGQFIEHLGRCVYGGIWAEMLEDRKFYFPITEDYNPYKSLQDTQFPVVGASPWQILGAPTGLQMTTAESFVGQYTPALAAGTAIRQHDLAIVSGQSYDGYIWLRNAGSERSTVEVSLSPNAQGKNAQSATFTVPEGEYQKFPYTFTASTDSDKASLTLGVTSGHVLVGTLSLMPADNIRGMRADTLALLKELDSPIYRWPGGNFVSGYNWRDGIGDRDRRPPRKNPAWTGIEHNDFGTDEFIDFCREIGTEPTIAANTGFGDAYSAAQWVEYCNATGDTIGGQWRVDNGNYEPYNVKYWCVGNEMWGPWQLGFMQLDHYVLKHNEVADAMRAVDDELVLIGVGAVDQINKDHDPAQAEANKLWSVGMMEKSADHMEMISEHFYSGQTPWTQQGELPTLEHVVLMRDQIRRITNEHRRLQPEIEALKGKTMPIAMDEWNYWHRDYQYGELGCVYDLKDALGTVVALHEFYRQSDLIQIANYAQTVNVIGCIKTSKTEAEFATTGIALKLYRAQWQPIPVQLPVDAHGHLDVAASKSEDGKVLTISVVNPTDKAATLDLNGLDLPTRATIWTITGPDHRARNAPGKERQVDALESNGNPRQGIKAPALSSVLYRIEL
ncbi:alpha-L-arabinofuranosidase C-terminal domain-containing protein [Pelagicoccus enzymogenes]|uniref:alpha-L-arabinofuranosidase C-terminal domain-containing protein n=1 Tax=Pelagicoccus enzymogenes TaxID=2773457 RepID=UPI00280F60C5|nr:alpha-L-arabinofuranosidase C-terminal domain-containing protein [Pelagicoccus enzymogenes]MDQ8197746.1 alpha-L-arabinofuranosidase C-terminal domain-containing protein [Pelagicoccus enzymogenes]